MPDYTTIALNQIEALHRYFDYNPKALKSEPVSLGSVT